MWCIVISGQSGVVCTDESVLTGRFVPHPSRNCSDFEDFFFPSLCVSDSTGKRNMAPLRAAVFGGQGGSSYERGDRRRQPVRKRTSERAPEIY